MKAARLLMSAIALTLAATACGEDKVEPEVGITEEEAIALFDSRESMASLLGDSTKLISNSENGAVYRCPQGGQVTMVVTEFSMDTVAADTTRIVFGAQTTPSGCKTTAGDREFTLDGDPSVSERATIYQVQFVLDRVEGSSKGGLKWALEDRSGNCEIDLTLTAEIVDGDGPSDPKVANTYQGLLCGHQVKFTRTEDVVVTEG